MNKPLPFSIYNNDMDMPKSYTSRFRQLRWKLTLSYTGVTVGALLTLELIILASTASGVIQTELIKSISGGYMPSLQFLLSETPPDQEEITDWLGRMSDAIGPTIPLTFNANDIILIVGNDGVLLGSSPPDIFGSDATGSALNMQALPGLAAPLQAALGGEDDVDNLYNSPGPDESVILAIPIWNEAHESVLGVLIAVGEFPTVLSVLSTIIPIMGISFLIVTLIVGTAGTIYGSVAARGLSNRLDRLSEGTRAWSQGDFTQLVEDTSEDEIGQLAYNLNQMAQELESLLDTRRELVVIEERNRLGIYQSQLVQR
jgi:HAMP domain-containing protein